MARKIPIGDETGAGEQDSANLSMSLSMTFQVIYNENNLLNITEKFYQTLGEGKRPPVCRALF